MAPDRYMYIAGAALAILVGGGVRAVTGQVRAGVVSPWVARLAAAGGVAALVALAITSWSYSAIWRQSESLWRWAVEVDPACAACHANLGASILAGPSGTDRAGEAETLFRRALTLRPDLRQAYFNLAAALVVQGRYAEAEPLLRSYVERAPASFSGRERLGRLYLLQDRHADAIAALRTALALEPAAPGVRRYLAEALQGRARELQTQGRAAEAEALRSEAQHLEREDARLTGTP
jgi:tetratricopeptide (TPR) repeat protein